MQGNQEKDDPLQTIRGTLPNSEEFTRTLGQVAWLMSLSKNHKNLQFRDLEQKVLTPLLMKQVRVYTKGNQPLAAIIWAYASDAVKDKIAEEGIPLLFQDWRSGDEVVIVDCISPFISSGLIETEFLNNIKSMMAQRVIQGS